MKQQLRMVECNFIQQNDSRKYYDTHIKENMNTFTCQMARTIHI